MLLSSTRRASWAVLVFRGRRLQRLIRIRSTKTRSTKSQTRNKFKTTNYETEVLRYNLTDFSLQFRPLDLSGFLEFLLEVKDNEKRFSERNNRSRKHDSALWPVVAESGTGQA